MVFGQIYKRLNRIYKMNSIVSVLIVVENGKTEINETYANKVFTKKIVFYTNNKWFAQKRYINK